MDQKSDDNANSAWMVVNTRPKREAEAMDNLTRQGFAAYCPLVVKRIRHARRSYDARRPLFPTYLFVAWDHAQHWTPIMSTYGVKTIVYQGTRPALLDDALVAGLKAREVDGVIQLPEKPFEVGQSVSLRGGPMDGLVARIIDMRPNDRIVVLLDLLNRPVRTVVNAASLAAHS